MKKAWRTGILAVMAMGFWGILYPELCMTRDTYQIVYELKDAYANVLTAEQIEAIEQEETGIYYDILEASPKQIKLRSRILTEIQKMINLKNKDKDS